MAGTSGQLSERLQGICRVTKRLKSQITSRKAILLEICAQSVPKLKQRAQIIDSVLNGIAIPGGKALDRFQ
jgi:hypothetical protein